MRHRLPSPAVPELPITQKEISSSPIHPQRLHYIPLKYALMGSFLLLIIPILIAIMSIDYHNAKSDL